MKEVAEGAEGASRLFRIRHVTRYDYSIPVRLGPQIIRLRPREGPTQHIKRYEESISPEPEGISEVIDAEGNLTTLCWFGKATEFLSFHVESDIEVKRFDPFGFVMAPAMEDLPPGYGTDAFRLGACLALPRLEGSGEVAAFAEAIAREASGKTLAFVALLCRGLSQEIRQVERPSGVPWEPERVLREKLGACRDVSVLFIACCRLQGLAARFVSGYQEPVSGFPPNLHAWVEVYLPPAGWRAFDPSLGLAVTDGHVAVAAAADPADAAPVSGIFYDAKARSELSIDLQVEVSETGLLKTL